MRSSSSSIPVRVLRALLAPLCVSLLAPIPASAQNDPPGLPPAPRRVDEPPAAESDDEGNPPEVRRARVVPESSSPPSVSRPPTRRTPERKGPRPVPRDTGSPESDLLDYANHLYQNKYYDLSALQFKKYVVAYPRSSAAAHYRLGESYLRRGNIKLAEDAYRRLLQLFSTGEYAGAGAYRLASLSYNVEKYAAALPYFGIAEKHADNAEVRLRASYFKARTLQHLGRNGEARRTYDSIVKREIAGGLREPSLLALARIDAETDRPESALEKFAELKETAVLPRIRAEAATKAGMISSELGQLEESNAFFEHVLTMRQKEANEWKSAAQYGLLNNYYGQEDYDGVIAAYRAHPLNYTEDTEGKVLLLVGNAYRKKGKYVEAIRSYNRVERRYPDSAYGQEAAYQKLYCLYKVKDVRLISYSDIFIDRLERLNPDSEYLDMALLLKAEILFDKKKYEDASTAYGKIRIRNIPVKVRGSFLYKKGWALLDAKQYEPASASFSEFLTRYGDDDRAPKALVKRAECFKGMEIYDMALKDYERILEKYPKTQVAELSIQQMAFIKGEKQDIDGMIAAFEGLLRDYPKTKAVGEARYWIGWGYYKNEDYDKAIESLKKARETDGGYFERASLFIVSSYYYKKDVDNLASEVNVLLARKTKQKVPADVLYWLGLKFFERDDFVNAARFLELAVDRRSPEGTPDIVWNRLGRSYLKQGQYRNALQPFEIYLERVKGPSRRARILLNKGTVLSNLGRYAEAEECAKEVLRLEKEGRTNAFAWILLGDNAMAQKEYENASRSYIIPSQMFVDPKVTPIALAKAAKAFEMLGQTDKAEEVRAELKRKYPDHHASK